MSEGSLTKEQLLREFADAYERIIAAAIAAAILAAQRGVPPIRMDGGHVRSLPIWQAGSRSHRCAFPPSLGEWRPSSLGILPRTT